MFLDNSRFYATILFINIHIFSNFRKQGKILKQNGLFTFLKIRLSFFFSEIPMVQKAKKMISDFSEKPII